MENIKSQRNTTGQEERSKRTIKQAENKMGLVSPYLSIIKCKLTEFSKQKALSG